MGVAKLTDQNTVVPESDHGRVERELRFLLNDLPEGLNRTDPHLQITDNYITGTRLRIRKVRDPKTNKWIVKFTQKFAPEPENPSRTMNTNIYLNALEADTLAVFEGNEIRKNRYHFDFEGRRFSIDMFLGDLLGLTMAKTSFETDEEMAAFEKPPFALADVTNIEIFSGGKLCELTFADIRKEAQKRGWVKAQSAN